MEIEGKIKVIFEKQVFGSGFEKREFVVTTDEQYPQDIKFELFKEKCEMIDTYKVNQPVVVHFNLRGNEYNGKYFVNLGAWRIEAQSDEPRVISQDAPAATETADPFGGGSQSDDLPF